MTDAPRPRVDPPLSLVELQREFGRAIATPFEFIDDAGNYRVRLDRFPPGLVAQLLPREDLGMCGADRLATYNQQYWFRLFTVLQEEYPLVRHLLGVTRFNHMASAYLTAYPSRSPTLRDLSNDLSRFLSDDHEWNRPVIREAAALEYAFIQIFDAAQRPPLDLHRRAPEALTSIAERPLVFQPHVHLFIEHWNLVALRELARTDVDDERVLTPEPCAGDRGEEARHWVLYRGAQGPTSARIDATQFRLLDHIRRGAPLGEALDEVAAVADESELAHLTDGLQTWFGEWAARGWFAAPE
ncbi:MAG: putative DNA-binding domain-containing protein [Planctomycetes bacterium]|nr:putative DNA-binding domain-containing protein [Planctomycetota bacterium]